MFASEEKPCRILQYEAKTGLAAKWRQVAAGGGRWRQTISDIKRVVLFEFWQKWDICFKIRPYEDQI